MKASVGFAAIAAAIIITAGAPVRPYAAADTVSVSETVDFGQAAKKSPLSKIKSDLFYFQTEDDKIPVLKKSRKIKNCFIIDEDETLIIPKGKTLTLCGGADIAGNIYIESGGKLVLDKFSVNLTGNIMCSGTISVKNGTLYCFDDSTLYVDKNGSFTAADGGGTEEELNGRIGAEHGANVVCLGKCNIPDPTFAAEPVSAVYCRQEFGGYVKKVQTVTDISKILEVKCGSDPSEIADFADCYTVLFSGGGCVAYTANGTVENGWSNIAGVDVGLINSALREFNAG